jgi:MFS family permease
MFMNPALRGLASASARRETLIRFTLVASGLLTTFGFFAVSAVLPRIESSFSTDSHAALLTSLIPGATALAFAASSPAVGWLIDRYGWPLVYGVSLTALAFVGMISGFMPSLEALIAMRLVTGAAISGVANAGSAGIGAMSEAERPRLYGIQAFLGGAAGIPLFPLTGLIAEHFGWRWVFGVYVVALPFAALCMIFLRSASPAPDRPANAALASARVPPRLLLLGAFMGLAMFSGTALMPFATRAIGITNAAMISIPLAAMSLVSLLGSGGYALVERRLGLRGVFALALSAIGLGLVLAGAAQTLATLAVANAILGIGLGLLMPNLFAAGAAACPDARGRALSLIAAAIYGVQALLPFGLLPLSQKIGLAGTFLGSGAAAFALAISFLVVKRRGPAPVGA